MNIFSLNIFPSEEEDIQEKINLNIDKYLRDGWPYVLEFHPNISFFLSKPQLLSIANSITAFFDNEEKEKEKEINK